ncbi:protein-export chaperone SecB [Sphingoaurantiacus capsulatus]|uniref:Protein-export protein SecB n=1 Tax=Sphingoaurantiacus capsulatus TaxID=1771310 RepID=A0ABV7X8K3_9SPHN
MADETDAGAPETPEIPVANGADTAPQVGIIAQYVKDLSFENPNAPRSFQSQAQPQIEVNVNVQARRQSEDVFEVDLKIETVAKGDGQTAFVVDLLYSGLFGLRNIPDEALEPFLVVEAPRILFPFARRIIADASRDGGFPPLMLEPIDFATLYMAQRQGGGEAFGQVEGQA